MKPGWSAVLIMLLSGCATFQGTGGSGPSPEPKPATQTSCQKECVGRGHRLMGCIWLADIKMEWEGALVVPPVPVESGGRLAITHCCCNYPALMPKETEELRRQWKNAREPFREEWGKKFGAWPTEGGKFWPGHQIHDLGHGGHPTDPNNILPTSPEVHDVFSKAYPGCYEGVAPWRRAGSYWPYTDN